MSRYQLSGNFQSVTVTTTPQAIPFTGGVDGFIITNPDATNSIFVHFQPTGTAAPSATVNLRGIRVYPGTSFSVTIAEGEWGGGCDAYIASNAGSIVSHIYGVK